MSLGVDCQLANFIAKNLQKYFFRLLALKSEILCEACSVRADHYEEEGAGPAKQLVVVEWRGRIDPQPTP